MSTFRILVVWDVLLVDGSEVFKNVNQQNNNTAEASNFAVATFLI